MAQVVGYFQDNIEYTEGPFVAVQIMNQFRIECEARGHKTCVLPHSSVYQTYGSLIGCKTYEENARARVDALNALVATGKIVLMQTEGGIGVWVTAEYAAMRKEQLKGTPVNNEPIPPSSKLYPRYV